MARKNPQTPLEDGVLYEDFSTGRLNTDLWSISNGTMPSQTADHIGFWTTDAVNLDEGMLGLKLSQTNTVDNGAWDAQTNTPPLASLTGYSGQMYMANVAGLTTLDGHSNWLVGDTALFDGTKWRKINFAPSFMSAGGQIMSTNTYGYGSYEFIFKPSSNGGLPTAQNGEPVSGSVTSLLNLLRYESNPYDINAYDVGNVDQVSSFDQIDIEIEGRSQGNLSNYVQLTSGSVEGVTTTGKSFQLSPEDGFMSVRYVWAKDKIEFWVNDKLVQTNTTNVPHTPGRIIFNHMGTNSISFGGLASPGVVRNMWVSQIKFVPLEKQRTFSGAINAYATLRGSIETEAPGITKRDFSGLISASAVLRGDFYIEGFAGQPRYFAGTMSGASSLLGSFEVTNTNAGVSVSFSGVMSAIASLTGSFTRAGGGVAGNTGWKNPGTISAAGWVNPDNMKTADEAFATYSAPADTETPALYAYNWGLGVPADSTINGIEVRAKGKVQTGSQGYSYFRVINQSTFRPCSVAEKQISFGSSGGSTINTGWLNPTLTSSTGWIDANDVFAQDGDSAYYTQTIANVESPTFRAYGFTGLTIPNGIGDNTVINGIEVRVFGYSTSAVEYMYMVLSNADGSINSQSKPITLPLTTPAYVTIGGASDLWGGKVGVGAWSPADFNQNFLVYLGFGGVTQVNLDHIQVRVSYTSGAGSAAADYITIGSPTDVWSGVDETGDNVYDREFTASQVNDPNFAFWGAFGSAGNGANFQLDNIQMRVSYTTPLIVDGGATTPTARNTDWVSPGSVSSLGWTDPTNTLTDNGANASNVVTNGETPTMRNLGFVFSNIPSTATIDGIEVRTKGQTSITPDYQYVSIGNSGGDLNSVETKDLTPIPVSPTAAAYTITGGPTDKWGGHGTPWVPADFGDFMISQAWGATAATTVSVDHVQARVWYTDSGSTGPTNPSDPPPAYNGAVIPLPSKIVATYFTGWSGQNIVDVPMSYNQIYLFHSTPVSGGNGAFTNSYASTFTSTRVQTVRGRGQRVVFTVGGANAAFFFQNRTQSTNFLNSVKADINALGGCDGLDFNLFEQFTQQYGSGANATLMGNEMAWIAGQLKQTYGNSFSISCPPAPGGGYAPADRVITKIMNDAGVLDYAAPQFYDSADLVQPALIQSLTTEWVNHLGSAAKVVIGFGSNYPGGSTLDQAKEAMSGTLATHPTIRGAMGWSAQDDRGSNWTFGAAMKSILGSSNGVPPTTAPAPAPAPSGSAPVALPSKILSTYYTGWSGGNINSIPTTYNHIYLFHLTPSGDYSGDGSVSNSYTGVFSATAVQQWRSGGRRAAITIGGQNAGIYFTSRSMTTNCLNTTLTAINAMGGVDEVNFNFFEAFSAPAPNGKFPSTGGSPRAEWVQQATEMKWLADQLKVAKPGLTISMAPAPGAGWAPFDRYLATFMGSSLDYAGPQMYDAEDYASVSNVVMYTQQWISLIGASKVVMGFGSNYSTTVAMSPANCATAYSQIKASNPTIRGAYGWSLQNDAAAGYTFGTQMRNVL